MNLAEEGIEQLRSMDPLETALGSIDSTGKLKEEFGLYGIAKKFLVDRPEAETQNTLESSVGAGMKITKIPLYLEDISGKTRLAPEVRREVTIRVNPGDFPGEYIPLCILQRVHLSGEIREDSNPSITESGSGVTITTLKVKNNQRAGGIKDPFDSLIGYWTKQTEWAGGITGVERIEIIKQKPGSYMVTRAKCAAEAVVEKKIGRYGGETDEQSANHITPYALKIGYLPDGKLKVDMQGIPPMELTKSSREEYDQITDKVIEELKKIEPSTPQVEPAILDEEEAKRKELEAKEKKEKEFGPYVDTSGKGGKIEELLGDWRVIIVHEDGTMETQELRRVTQLEKDVYSMAIDNLERVRVDATRNDELQFNIYKDTKVIWKRVSP